MTTKPFSGLFVTDGSLPPVAPAKPIAASRIMPRAVNEVVILLLRKETRFPVRTFARYVRIASVRKPLAGMRRVALHCYAENSTPGARISERASVQAYAHFRPERHVRKKFNCTFVKAACRWPVGTGAHSFEARALHKGV